MRQHLVVARRSLIIARKKICPHSRHVCVSGGGSDSFCVLCPADGDSRLDGHLSRRRPHTHNMRGPLKNRSRQFFGMRPHCAA